MCRVCLVCRWLREAGGGRGSTVASCASPPRPPLTRPRHLRPIARKTVAEQRESAICSLDRHLRERKEQNL